MGIPRCVNTPGILLSSPRMPSSPKVCLVSPPKGVSLSSPRCPLIPPPNILCLLYPPPPQECPHTPSTHTQGCCSCKGQGWGLCPHPESLTHPPLHRPEDSDLVGGVEPAINDGEHRSQC